MRCAAALSAALLLLLLLLLSVSAAVAVGGPPSGGGFFGKTAAEWQGRRVYQLLTDRFGGSNATCDPAQEVYCGGTFKGIQDHLDYIAGMGFNAIWISPVPVNYHLGYHGYWATDFFAINPHFGTAADLQNMVNAAKAMDIWVMIDIVVNHVGPVGNDFGGVSPFNDSSHYHQDCPVTQYICNTQQVHDCRLANLPDLNQDVPFVQQQLQAYVQWLLNTFSFAGIRMDTVMYIKQSYWAGLSASVSGTYIAGEVWSDFSCNAAYTSYGIDGTLNYPLFYTIQSVFQQQQSMRNLGSAWRQQLTLKAPDNELNFIDNHDNNRFLHGGVSLVQLRSALAHMFFTNGIPCVYYGTEQQFSGGINNNRCREALWPTKYNTATPMYRFIALLNQAAAKFKPYTSQVEERWQDDTFYAYIRGPFMVVTTNSLQDETRTIPNLPFAGMTVINWLNPSQTFTGASTMTITVPANQSPMILVPQN